MLLSFLKFPLPVLRHRKFFRVSARFSFVYARQLVEEGVRQNPAFVQNGENVAFKEVEGGICMTVPAGFRRGSAPIALVFEMKKER